ncbi:DUF1638 domain-containing protein [uncultured Thiothrix sp.]|uniref:DUF1638 domain-containing protein n=1 Tax=uncultured Thiothrix sp. TaxID=223185 RepID=UPI00262F6684|nr:DUF1638 domain-containing protein [uncultured Thiothrix sp.]HMT94009.1 DUF1638 domain-containing protein [Thiolinea sp.]
MSAQVEPVLVLACGALAREIQQLKLINGWEHLKINCLEADLHNRPERIPERVRANIRRYRPQFSQIFVAYADCGTGGLLDRVLAEEGVERLPGAHCYATFAGQQSFAELAEAELGSFYLTDFLARHFERLVIKGMQLDKHPELMPLYFNHYKRLVYLAQTSNPELLAKAQAAAEFLRLEFKLVPTGYGELATELARIAQR